MVNTAKLQQGILGSQVCTDSHADPWQFSPAASSLTDWDLNDARVHTHWNLTEPSAVWIPRIHEVTAVRLSAFGGIRRRRRIGHAWISRRHLHIHLKLWHFFFNPSLNGTKRGPSPSLSGLVPRFGAMERVESTKTLKYGWGFTLSHKRPIKKLYWFNAVRKSRVQQLKRI